MSRTQAVLKLDNGALCLTDLGSSNGTFVNNLRLGDQGEVCTGDIVGWVMVVVWWVCCYYRLYRFGYHEMMGESEKGRCVVARVEICLRDGTEDRKVEDDLEVTKDFKENQMEDIVVIDANL